MSRVYDSAGEEVTWSDIGMRPPRKARYHNWDDPPDDDPEEEPKASEEDEDEDEDEEEDEE